MCGIEIALICALAAADPPEAAWLDGFRDGVSHWQKQNDKFDYPRYSPTQFREIADNLLLYQRANGGWPKDLDMLRILSDEERRAIASKREAEDTSFDNRNTYTQVEYLARVFERTSNAPYRQSCIRGIEFILSAQYPNGGWPHSFPRKTAYYPRITFMDDVMVDILTTLRKIAAGEPPFEFIPPDLRARCRQAVERGDALVLKLQVRVNGTLTGWAGQYDENSLEPCQGRTFELPALTGNESTQVIRYLMRIPNPSPEVQAAVDAGVAWLERSKLTGFRLERVPAPTIRYEHHTSRYDVVVVQDSNAPPIWARFYEIDTNRPFLANRDGKKVYRLEDVTRERRTGGNWFGYYPRDLLAREYPEWKKRWKARPNRDV